MTDPIDDADDAAEALAIQLHLTRIGNALMEVAAEYNAGRYVQGRKAMDVWYDTLGQYERRMVHQVLAEALWPWAVAAAHGDRKRFEHDLGLMLRAEAFRDGYVGRRRAAEDGPLPDPWRWKETEES